jgi:phage-related protein
MCGKTVPYCSSSRNLWGEKMLNNVGKIFDEIFNSFLQRIVKNISKHLQTIWRTPERF